MPLTIETPPALFQGPTTGYARNDALANGAWVRSALARQLNHLLARHGTVIPGKGVMSRTPRSVAAESRLWVTRYRASPNGGMLVVVVHLVPTDTTIGSPRWYVKIDAAKKADQVHNIRGGPDFAFADVFEMRMAVPVQPGVKHTVELWTADNCRVVGWDLHEAPMDTLLVGADTVADYTYALPLSPIRSDTVSSLRAAADVLWRRARACHMAWSADDPDAAVVVSSTSPVPLWGDSKVGPTAPTIFRNSYGNENLLAGATARAIPMVCWAAGARTNGAGSVLVRFSGANHPSGIDVVINGSLNIYESSAFTLLPATGGDAISVQCLTTAANTTGQVLAAGCFPFIGP
jgi:hypothetical protein